MRVILLMLMLQFHIHIQSTVVHQLAIRLQYFQVLTRQARRLTALQVMQQLVMLLLQFHQAIQPTRYMKIVHKHQHL